MIYSFSFKHTISSSIVANIIQVLMKFYVASIETYNKHLI